MSGILDENIATLIRTIMIKIVITLFFKQSTLSCLYTIPVSIPIN